MKVCLYARVSLEEVILTMYQDGKNGMEISRTTGIAKSTIYEVIKGLNSSIPIPEQPLINNNHSKEDNFDESLFICEG